MSKEKNEIGMQINNFEYSDEEGETLSPEKHNVINFNGIGAREFIGIPKKLDFSAEQLHPNHQASDSNRRSESSST